MPLFVNALLDWVVGDVCCERGTIGEGEVEPAPTCVSRHVHTPPQQPARKFAPNRMPRCSPSGVPLKSASSNSIEIMPS